MYKYGIKSGGVDFRKEVRDQDDRLALEYDMT